MFEYIEIFCWIIGILFVFVGSFIYLHWPDDYYKKKGIPGPEPRFILTDFAVFAKKSIREYDADIVKDYGKIVGICAIGRRYLMISDVDMLREIFVKDFDNFSDRGALPNRGLMGQSVFDMNGEGWRQQRHHLSPYFTAGTLKMSSAAINRVLDNLLGFLDKKCDTNEMIDFKDMAQMMTMDAICSTAYGVEVDSIKDPDMMLLKKARELNKAFNTGNLLFMFAFLFPWFGKLLDFLHIQSVDSRYIEKFIRQLIEQRKESKQDEYHDFLNILLQERTRNNKGLTDDEIIANAMLFLLAGYDTTSNALAFLFYNLTVNPECQEKVHQQIEKTIGADRPTYENVQKLSYLDMCIEETLRIYPIGVRLERKCVKDTTVNGVLIEKGTMVAYPIWTMQRNPDVWPDPETFQPERFSPDNKKDRNPMYYSPFGVGPRHCIGMRLALLEMKLAAVRILQQFKVVTNSKTQIPLELSPTSFQVVPKDGIWLSLERRK